MDKPSFINEVRVFAYTIVNGSGPSINRPVGHLYVQETRNAASRGGLRESAPDYGFRITDGDGNVVATIAPGMWPFVKKCIETPVLHVATAVVSPQTPG